MIKIAFNITDNKQTGLQTIQILIENTDPSPVIDAMRQWFEVEMLQASIHYKGSNTAIQMTTDNKKMVMLMRQAITEYFFDAQITMNDTMEV